jgi:hypothetical protein
MHPNEQLIQKFYSAFQVYDAEGMCACYQPDVIFSDPVFGRLAGPRAVAMWEMLCSRATDLKIRFEVFQADDTSGRAHWEAWYSFGPKRRPVHNVVEAAFVFRAGLISQHMDTFDLRRWARMALGPIGLLLGWTPLLRSKIRQDALRGLRRYQQSTGQINDQT